MKLVLKMFQGVDVYNKIDLVEQLSHGLQRSDDNTIQLVRVSATTKQGMDGLLTAISERLCYDIVRGKLVLAPTQAKERALLYDIGAVDNETINEKGNWILDIATPKRQWQKICFHFSELSHLLKER